MCIRDSSWHIFCYTHNSWQMSYHLKISTIMSAVLIELPINQCPLFLFWSTADTTQTTKQNKRTKKTKQNKKQKNYKKKKTNKKNLWHINHNYLLSAEVYSVLAGEDDVEAAWRNRDTKCGRKGICVLRHQKTYSVPQTGTCVCFLKMWFFTVNLNV